MTIPIYPDERLGHLPARFFTALGYLHHAFTSLEVQMACIISNFITAGYDPADHRQLFYNMSAVTGGMRMDASKDTINRLLRVSGAPDEIKDYVALIFKQIGEIQFFRNRLTHYSTARSMKRRSFFVNTDIELAKENTKAVTIVFSYDALHAARHDLALISNLLDDLFDPIDEEIILRRPSWQYKPSMLTR